MTTLLAHGTQKISLKSPIPHSFTSSPSINTSLEIFKPKRPHTQGQATKNNNNHGVEGGKEKLVLFFFGATYEQIRHISNFRYKFTTFYKKNRLLIGGVHPHDILSFGRQTTGAGGGVYMISLHTPCQSI